MLCEAEARNRLAQSVRLKKRPRTFRVAISPLRMIVPKVLMSAKVIRDVKSRTFWGGTMNIILPEVVSTYIWRYGFFEEDVSLFMLYALKEGMTFIDVGGHFGYFTLLGSYLAGATGKVLTFEPMLATYNQLRINVVRNASNSNIDTIQAAAYSENTTLTFFDYGLEKSAYNSAFSIRNGGSAGDALPMGREVPVDARKIDDVLEEKNIRGVDLIKIDAESSEIYVLQGLLQTIKKFKPGIIVEVGDLSEAAPMSSKDIVKWLIQQGYDAYEARGGNLVPHEAKDQYEYGNLLFMANRRL